MKNIWSEIAEEFDNSLPRLTAVYIKESDSTVSFYYPTGENKTAFFFDRSVRSVYDQPPKLRLEFGAYEYPSITGSIGPNRALFKKQTSYPSMIKRELEYMNLPLFGTEILARAVDGSVSWSFDLTSRTEGQRYNKSLYTLISSDSDIRVKKYSSGIGVFTEDATLYLSSNHPFDFGLYPDELSMKKDVNAKCLSKHRTGHILVLKQELDLSDFENIRITFGISEKSIVRAKTAANVKDIEKRVESRENKWFSRLPNIGFSSEREERAYYKCWWTIKSNYYDHPEWGHCITECLPVYKGIWQWAIPSVEWHSEQNRDYPSEWIKKAMDMLLSNQRDDGYVTHAIYIDEKTPGEHWGSTSTIQTPHLPWVAVRYYYATGDIESVKKWFGPLKKYYDYLNSSRDECYKKLHLWAITSSFDTGLDTTSVFQRVTYGDEKGKEAYCYPAIMAAERARYEKALAELSVILGENPDFYQSESNKTVDAMNLYLWDKEKSWYGVLHADGELDTRVGVDGLFPLVYRLAPERAGSMKPQFERLIGEYGVRTVAEGEKGFRADVYWRGACWPKTCSLGMSIASEYYPDLKDRLFDGILNFVHKYPNIWECINVSTGELARSDLGFICTPGMTSNVGAGDIIGSILMYHGFEMYEQNMALPLTKMTDFHHRGLYISLSKSKDGWIASAKAAEAKSAEVAFKVGDTVKSLTLSEDQNIIIG